MDVDVEAHGGLITWVWVGGTFVLWMAVSVGVVAVRTFYGRRRLNPELILNLFIACLCWPLVIPLGGLVGLCLVAGHIVGHAMKRIRWFDRMPL